MNTPLAVSIDGGELVIRIGLNTLAHAIASGNDLHEYDERSGDYLRRFAVTNPYVFAQDIVIELQREEEDGSTPLSHLFDQMGQYAIEEGSTGVDHEQVVKFGEAAAVETWRRSCDNDAWLPPLLG
jgi:hypothetical protein